ncbi:hypothetical protein [Cellulomonas sp. NPDC089187]|uniref:hypothetical protein n=1 Tax=Cellulomonas sp. NPDC089187 TaxID=3154970 RepID=UPI0034292559
MRTRSVLVTAAVASTAALATARLRTRLPQPPGDDQPLAVTVLLSTEQIEERTGGLPPSLRAVLEQCRRTPAPGDRGTELRLASGDPARRGELRLLKQLLETGHVLPPDDTSDRPATPGGRLLDLVIAKAGRRGRL